MQREINFRKPIADRSARWLFGTLLLATLNFPVIAKGDETFRIPENSEKSTALPSTPAETVASAKLPDGFKLGVFAAEPDVHNPIAMTTDERGRLWVAENYSWSGNNFGNFDGSIRDRILIFEDEDGDGVYDTRKVFADNLRKLTSIEIGNGGVWAISLPNVLFIPDKDRDDQPDGPAEIVFDGIDEGAVGHTPANGLKWGPDGWIYARHGILATSNIGQPGATDSQRIKINTGVWRFHPVTRRIETVMHGMTNAWGYDFDEHGEMFVINTVIGHLWHVVPGAHVERMFGVDINPNSYQLIGQTADHVHWDTGELWHEIRDGISNKTDAAGGGHAHIGLMIYQGDNWPEQYRNRLYTLNLHGRRLNSNVLEREGTAFVGKRAPDLCFIADPWFRGMELLTGADGGVYLSDWSDTGECHDHDGVHRTSGRIYKLTYENPTKTGKIDLATASDQELVNALGHANTWWARTAKRILSERYFGNRESPEAKQLHSQLLKLVIASSNQDNAISGTINVPHRLRVLETLFVTGMADEGFLIQLLGDENENVQATALKFLVDGLIPGSVEPSELVAKSLLAKAKSSTSGLVDLYLAASLQRLPNSLRIEMANELSLRSQWKDDRSFPKMLWYGFEPTVSSNPAQAIRIAGKSPLPLLTENIARRITQDLEKDPAAVDQLVSGAAQPDFADPLSVVRGMAKALAGWHKAPAPENWDALAKRLEGMDTTSVSSELQSLQLVFGDGKALEQLVAISTDGAADPEVRRQAVRSLSVSKAKDFENHLIKLLDDRVVGLDAIRGLAYYDLPSTPQALLARWLHLGPFERKEIVNTLASRPVYAKALLKGVQEGVLSASEISAFHARQMQSFEDAELTESIAKHWGDVKVSDEAKKELVSQWHKKLTPENLAKADLSQGRALFQQNCANCHILYGVGAKIGPDITGSNRNNLDYLLENILDPSASVGAEFRTVIILLEDDRVVTGVIVEQTDRTLTIQTSQEKEIVDRRDIASMKQSSTSLMPDGIVQNLSDEQVRDLFAYLMHDSQVSLPDNAAK